MGAGGYEDFDVRATLGLAAEPQSAGQARRFIREFCSAADLGEDICQKAALLVSELVTNAVLHGRSRATLVAGRPDGNLHVAVLDHDPQLPQAPEHLPSGSTSGRGLRIVATVADRWGIEPVDGGKAVWFELDLGAAHS